VAGTRYALLLRAINLGKVNRIPMADLRALLADEGHTNVSTLLQSGNVALDADLPPEAVGPSVELAIRRRFGFDIDVLVRTRDEFHRVLANNPFGDVVSDGSRYFVAFQAEPIGDRVADLLAGVEPGGDRWAVDGAELYVWCPEGLTKSPVMAALGKVKKSPPATVRNWNTVEKLAKLLG
jgi:uncharacterized protein (DUF1697 family)